MVKSVACKVLRRIFQSLFALLLVQGGDYNNGGKRTIYDGNRQQAMVIQGRTCNVQSFSDVIMNPDSVYGPTLFSTGSEFFRFGAKYNPVYVGNMSFISTE